MTALFLYLAQPMGSPPSAAVPTAHALPNHASAGRLSRLSGMRTHDMHERPPAHWPGAPRSRAVLPVAALIAFARVLASVLLLAALALPTASANRAPAGPRELAVRADNASSQLAVLEVDPPVLAPAQPACQQTLMVHVFAYSYGTPFVGMQPSFVQALSRSRFALNPCCHACHVCFRRC